MPDCLMRLVYGGMVVGGACVAAGGCPPPLVGGGWVAAGGAVGGMGVLVGSGGAGIVAATEISWLHATVINSTTVAEIQPRLSSPKSALYQDKLFVLAMMGNMLFSKAIVTIA